MGRPALRCPLCSHQNHRKHGPPVAWCVSCGYQFCAHHLTTATIDGRTEQVCARCAREAK